MRRRNLLLLLSVFMPAFFTYAQVHYTIEKVYPVRSGSQAVAVDKNNFYAISNREIGKYTLDGEWIAEWAETDRQKIKHMNSGVVVRGKLYCAHSNFPEVPMASSIEVFDTQTMRHIESISLGISIGSCTWILPKKNGWYVFFAHYDKGGKEPDRDARWSQLIEYDKKWNRKRGWTLPDSLLEEVRPHSLSGAVLIDGVLYCTGHDKQEAYLLRIPDRGMNLEWTDTINIPCKGQGIALDKDGCLWGIDRKNKQVVKSVQVLIGL